MCPGGTAIPTVARLDIVQKSLPRTTSSTGKPSPLNALPSLKSNKWEIAPGQLVHIQKDAEIEETDVRVWLCFYSNDINGSSSSPSAGLPDLRLSIAFAIFFIVFSSAQ